MTKEEALLEYCIRLGDDSLILGHRLSEWCGHGPILEEDIAMTNIALDLVGQSRTLLTYAGELEGKGRSEDDFAYMRPEREFKNSLLAEQPNGHFGDTMARQFYFSAYYYFFLQELVNSKDETLAAFAEKSLKEVTYHLRHTSEWIIRLGDGTEESHNKIQESINDLWRYTGELLAMDEVAKTLLDEGIGVDLNKVKESWTERVKKVLEQATLTLPEGTWMAEGGRKGVHTEHLGYILTDLQYMQRSYPGLKW